jgi:hypothetical protein
MPRPSDNEDWLIEIGDAIIQKKGRHGWDGITPLEKLVYCLWAADYGMRNAGDLSTAGDVYSDFHSEGRRLAEKLALSRTGELFALKLAKLEAEYFNQFEAVCDELRIAASAKPRKKPQQKKRRPDHG